jgi:hypothetical protein
MGEWVPGCSARDPQGRPKKAQRFIAGLSYFVLRARAGSTSPFHRKLLAAKLLMN